MCYGQTYDNKAGLYQLFESVKQLGVQRYTSKVQSPTS